MTKKHLGVTSLLCGTREQFEQNKDKYLDLEEVNPAALYIDKNTVYLVTNQDWVDWLTGKTDIPPKKEKE